MKAYMRIEMTRKKLEGSQNTFTQKEGLNCASSGIFRRDFHGACSLHLGNIPATILLQDAGLCHQQLA
jgi:hypothetical protein